MYRLLSLFKNTAACQSFITSLVSTTSSLHWLLVSPLDLWFWHIPKPPGYGAVLNTSILLPSATCIPLLCDELIGRLWSFFLLVPP